MDNSTKKKVKIILITFGILLIPMFFVFKRMYAAQIHKSVINNVYMESHIRENESTIVLKGIVDLDNAKKYSKNYYPLYSDQARLYCIIKDYNNALKVLSDYELINPHTTKTKYQKGLIFDAIGIRDSAVKYYRMVLLNNKDLKIKADSLSLYHWNFLIYGKDSALKYLLKYRDQKSSDEMITSIKNHIDTITYKDYAIEYLK
jgi:tetratricopeptide (TPR) repeat protein